ncbi:alpha/beta hydrolase [Methyloglobulus sp.]|uniref:alpha/beta fold hydrolase n=1 Tax=Methyloglobulus sp. TaxID=2518622 RepID=UPI0032B7BDB2
MMPRSLLIRGLLVFSGICCLAAILGSVYQMQATAADLKSHPAPGRMVNVNGLIYHLNCTGTGSPTIILEAGLGESSLSWYPVQAKLSQTTQVCAYDRAGLGWSDPADEPMSPEQVATNLHTLLRNAPITPPFVLVCHSRGGIFCRHYYHQFTQEVKGLVLVDSTHEQGAFREYPYVQADYLKQGIQIAIAPLLSRIGVIRLMGWANADRLPSPLPDDILAAKSAVQNRTDTTLAVINEITEMRKGLDPSTPPPASLGNLPLVVLTAGNGIDIVLAEREAKTSNGSVENAVAVARIERTSHEELAALSSNSKHVIADRSGHFIMYDQPDLLESNVLELLNSVRCLSAHDC